MFNFDYSNSDSNTTAILSAIQKKSSTLTPTTRFQAKYLFNCKLNGRYNSTLNKQA